MHFSKSIVVGVIAAWLAISPLSWAASKLTIADFEPIDLTPAGNPGSVFDPDLLAGGALATSFLFDTSSGTLTMFNGQTPLLVLPAVGEIFDQPTGPSVMVFAFDGINTRGRMITALGARPLAILSHADATFSGVVNVSGEAGGLNGRRSGGGGGPGAGSGGEGGIGPDANDHPPTSGSGMGAGGPGLNGSAAVGGDGGSFGGAGGDGLNPDNRYGDLTTALEAGSGGGGGGGSQINIVVSQSDSDGGGGGGGGGGVELGASGSMFVSSFVLANGGHGRDGEDGGVSGLPAGNGGGGSGGGIRLHGDSVLLTVSQGLSAIGGDGEGLDPGSSEHPGGGGGGGRILVEGGYVLGNSSFIGHSVEGGQGGGDPGTTDLITDRLIVAENTTRNIADSTNINGFDASNLQEYDYDVRSNATLVVNALLPGNVNTMEIGDQAELQIDNLGAGQAQARSVTGTGHLRIDSELTLTDGMNQTFLGTVQLNDSLIVDSDSDLTLSGNLSGPADLTKAGDGTLALIDDRNRYGGGTNLSAGVLSIADDGALGDGDLNLDGGMLRVTGTTVSNRDIQLNAPSTLDIDGGQDLTVHGQVSGSFLLIKAGGGKLVLTDAANDVQSMAVQRGELSIADDDALGAPLGDLFLGEATLRVTGTTASARDFVIVGDATSVADVTISVDDAEVHTITGQVRGSFMQGTLTKAGLGTLILANGSNDYSGGTIVETGLLLTENTAGSATGSGPVTVESGAAVGGSGRIGGALTVEAGALVTPGTSTGTLTVGSVNLDPNANFAVELAGGGGVAGVDFDQLVVTAGASLDGTLNVSLASPFTPSLGQSFEIIDVGGALSGAFSGLPQGALVGSFGGTDLFIDYASGDGNDVSLLATVAGDFDLNFGVDGFDFLTWQRGASPNPMSQSDLNAWQTNYGMVAPLAASATVVPEPGGLLILALGAMLFPLRPAWFDF